MPSSEGGGERSGEPDDARRRPVARAVDIVVPVHNEEACVDEFHERVARLGYASSLLFVDNASTDGTVARLERYPDVRIIRHTRNEGYGASIRDGIASSNAELIVVVDADLEYPPEAIPALVSALAEHPVVYGSRFLGPRPPAMSPVRRFGNRFVTALYNLLFRQRTTDLYTGMKGFRREAVPLSRLRRRGFEHVVELAAMIALGGLRIHEVHVDYVPRRHGASKMRHLPETAKCIGCLLGHWFCGVVLRRERRRVCSP